MHATIYPDSIMHLFRCYNLCMLCCSRPLWNEVVRIDLGTTKLCLAATKVTKASGTANEPATDPLSSVTRRPEVAGLKVEEQQHTDEHVRRSWDLQWKEEWIPRAVVN
nr:hypothetical protein [Tanacetum cinerariifolium]